MTSTSIGIRNLSSRVTNLHTRMQRLSEDNTSHKLPSVHEEQNNLHTNISSLALEIKNMCQKKGCYPADLADPSYRAYLWLAFLSKQQRFDQHLAFIQQFSILWNEKSKKRMSLKVFNSSHVFQCNQSHNSISVIINEGFLLCDESDLHVLISCCLKSNKKNLQELREISRSSSYKHIMTKMWQHTPQSQLSTSGSVYDLQILFGKINNEYFQGKLAQPRLRWSGRNATCRLGYYHPDSDTITISKYLDHHNIPEYVIAYVLYHEMLHKKVGLKEVNTYRIAHSSQFKQEEQDFNEYVKAEEFLHHLHKR